MRHHADDVAGLVADCGDRVYRSVGIRGHVGTAIRIRVPQNHLTAGLERLQQLWRREVVAFAMADGNTEHLTHAGGARERRVGLLHSKVYVLAAVLQATIPEHRAREETRFE